MGKIPVEWEVNKCRNVSLLITKGTTPTTLGYTYESDGINFIKVESIIEDGIIDP